MILAIFTFIPIIAILIFVHELGHYITAKFYGIKVLEFGFGYPPRIFGFRRGETLYSLNLLPLGGFVKMVGEEDPTDPRSLAARSIFQRFIVISSGAIMNMLLAILIFVILFMIPQQKIVGLVQIQQVMPNSPAEFVGLSTGDVIVKVDGHSIRNIGDLVQRINLKLGSESEWVIQKSSTLPLSSSSPAFTSYEVVNITPRLRTPEGQGPTGILIGAKSSQMEWISYPPWQAIPKGTIRVWETLILTKNEITRWIIGDASPQFSGPIGIAQITGQVAQLQFEGEANRSRFIRLLELAAFISINLAIINILPIPMLDGGRLLFLGIELVRRGKRVTPKIEGLVHMTGFFLLIGLIVIISYFDIIRIIRGESLFR